MKATTIALILLVIAATVCAQTAPPSQKVVPAAKPAATQAKPAAAPVAKPATSKAAAKAPAAKPATSKAAAKAPAAKPAAKPAKPAVSKAAKPAAKRVKPAVAKTAAPKPAATLAKAKGPQGKRDPFVSPIVHAEGTAACSNGKKCLAIDSIVLKGIVKSQAGMIAVVESSARRLSYFLRENDPVFNGYVVKITRDSVVFRENVMDNIGRQSTREVVKKVVAPVV